MEGQPAGPGRILLVEDLAIHRRMIPLRLGALGRDVHPVADTAGAETFLARTRPSLILLDVILPGKDGFTFCRELKADPARRDIPVMILTDLNSDAFARALESGADDQLSKRTDDAVLRIRTRLHLNLDSMRQGLRQGERAMEPVSILMASSSPGLRAQVEVQAQQDGHSVRFVKGLEALDQLEDRDRILILETTPDFEGLQDALFQLRADPATQDLAVLLICNKLEFPMLQTLETMVDDVLWKPLKAQATRFRLQHLAELAALNRLDRVGK